MNNNLKALLLTLCLFTLFGGLVALIVIWPKITINTLLGLSGVLVFSVAFFKIKDELDNN